MKKISISVSSVFILILILTHAAIFLSAGQDFMGIPYNVVDTNAYFSFMQQAREGHLLFTNRFTPEPVPYIFFNPVFLVVGWFSILLPPLLAYYLFKLLFLILFLVVVFRLIRIVRPGDNGIIGAFVLFGSGIGYLFLLLEYLGFKRYGSIDYWLASSNSMALNLAPLHFVLSVSLMIFIVINFYIYWNERLKKRLLYLILATILLSYIHLFDVITLGLAFLLYQLWLMYQKEITIKEVLVKNVGYIAAVSPAFIYTFYLFALNPFFRKWNEQNTLASPDPLHVLFGFLLPMTFAATYLIANRKRLRDIDALLAAWMLSGFILLYAPLNIQRRFIEGLYIPIMILGGLGFKETVLPRLNRLIRYRRLLILLVFLIIIPTSIYWPLSVYMDTLYSQEVLDYRVPHALGWADRDAIAWLAANTRPEDIVLASYPIGNYIPRISGNRVFLGHWAQTIDFDQKKYITRQFYRQEKNNVLGNYHIEYVYYGPYEKKIGNIPPNLEKVYENGEVSIYKP